MFKSIATKYFLMAFLPSLLLITTVGYFVHLNNQASILASTIGYKEQILNLKVNYIQDFYNERLEDLFLISNLENLKTLGSSPEISESVKKDFIAVARATSYYQIRWLDTLGHERLRVNFKNNEMTVVPETELQSKSHRDYFQIGQQLDLREIYISGIDLNMEYGEVEVPFEPVVRLIKPSTDKSGAKTGLLVLNVRMGDFLDNLKGIKTSEDQFDFSLLNQRGYWLTTSARRTSFGFMVDSLGNENFYKYFPDEWESIRSQESGSIFTGKGLFVFTKMCPSQIIDTFNQIHGSSLTSSRCDELYLVGRLPPEILNSQLNSHRPIIIVVVLALLLIVLSLVITISKLKERKTTYNLIRANKQLNVNEKILETRNMQLESFVRIASHDLREPLGTIKGVASMLEEEYTGGENKTLRGIRFIKECAVRMDRLTQAILEYSRTGKNSLLSEVDCMGLVESIVNDLHHSIEQTGAKIHYNNLPVIFAYEQELRQLFQNIISNAIRYRKEGVHPIIEINYESGKTHIFHISDNGVGIDQRDHSKIFKLFERANSLDDGLGIGLGMARKIAALHDGEIWVTSEVGVGSTFSFKLSKDLA